MDEKIIRNNGWIHGKSRLPGEADGDNNGKVLVWHAYQGAMLTTWDAFPRNQFNVYWMPISALDEIPWINAMEKPPTKSDADALNCVMVKDRRGEITVTGYHQFTWNKALTHWRPLPGPPSDAKELRQMT